NEVRDILRSPEFAGRNPSIILLADGCCELSDFPCRWLQDPQATTVDSPTIVNVAGDWQLVNKHLVWGLAVSYVDKESGKCYAAFSLQKFDGRFSLRPWRGLHYVFTPRKSGGD